MAEQIREVDVAILGAGSAGLSAFRAARLHTASVLLFDGGPLGTTCARVGCMPSKLLIAAAEAAHAARDAAGFGVRVPEVCVDGHEVMTRIRQEGDRFVSFVLRDIEALGDHLVPHYARFVDAHTLEAGDQRVKAKSIVLATGSRPQRLPFLQRLGDRLLVNDDVFRWERLPSSVAVFGPGVIGLELGQALHRLGVRVRMFGRGGAVGPLTDPELRAVAEEAFHRELALHPDARVESVERVGTAAVEVRWWEKDTLQAETFDYVLAATGRLPNVDHLELHRSGAALDDRGVPRFDPTTMQTSMPHIFIAGDADNDRPLLHEAADEGKIAGHNAGQYPTVTPGLRRTPLAVVFTDPQIAMVGTPFAKLEPNAVTGEVSFENQGRSRVMRKNVGRLRLYADHDTGRFVGAEMVGPAAEHLGHLLAWAHQSRMSVSQMLDMPYYHPVIEEGLRTALRDLCRKLGQRRCAPYIAGA